MGGEGKVPFTVTTPAVFVEESQELRPASVFDLDGTWLRWQMFDEWIKEMIRLGLFPEIVYAMAKKERMAYQNREGAFGDWVKKQVEAYSPYMKGVSVSEVKFAAHQTIADKAKRVHVFTRELARASKAANYRRAIISGSPTALVEAFSEVNGINIFLGTDHEEKDGVYTGVTAKEWVNDKAEGLNHLAKLYGFDLSRSVAIGDGWSDHRMLELVGYPICFNPEHRLRQLALERGWLVVVEKKDALHVYVRRDGVTRFVEFAEYLPDLLGQLLDDTFPAGRIHGQL